MSVITEKKWSIEYPTGSLLTIEQKSQISSIEDNLLIQKCNTRDEVKQVILDLTNLPYLQPSYIIKKLLP
jgi:hypothetical protein